MHRKAERGQPAREVAGDGGSGGMDERAGLRREMRRDECCQILDVAIGAGDRAKAGDARRGGGRVADRQHRQLAPGRGGGEGADAVGAGEQHGLRAGKALGQKPRRLRRRADGEHRRQQCVDAALGQRVHQRRGIVARPRDDGSSYRLLLDQRQIEEGRAAALPAARRRPSAERRGIGCRAAPRRGQALAAVGTDDHGAQREQPSAPISASAAIGVRHEPSSAASSARSAVTQLAVAA